MIEDPNEWLMTLLNSGLIRFNSEHPKCRDCGVNMTVGNVNTTCICWKCFAKKRAKHSHAMWEKRKRAAIDSKSKAAV